jgi:hypothetical protein
MKKLNSQALFIALGTLSIVFFSGCASKQTPPPTVVKKIVVDELNHKPTTYPVLKQNNMAQRAIVNMGVVLKTKVTSYKDRSDNLIASHDVYFWAKKPDFITTNTLPRKKSKFSYNGLKIDLSKSGLVDLPKDISKEAIRKNTNTEYDKKINDFINKQKEAKK